MSPAPALPESKDLSYHLTKRVQAQTPSVMKAYGKLLQARKTPPTSLAGGLPHHTLFPLQKAEFRIPSFQSLDGDVGSWIDGTAETENIHLKKTGPGTENDEDGILDFNLILQYGLTNGYPELHEKLAEYNHLVHGQPTSDQSVYLTLGNTDGVSKVFQLFIEPGDNVLAEEYSFASSLNSGRARGAVWWPVKIDGQGLIPEDLDRVLTEWDEDKQGKKPHLLYTIPAGQNPTGTVQPAERYDAIYALAQKHDLIIAEDDPYFPLQYTAYEPDQEKRAAHLAAARASLPPLPEKPNDEDARAVAKVFNEYANIRSYASRDVDGRVLRIDTFSKVFGPGIRTGWITASAGFQDRLQRVGETSTQVPNNVGQALLASYLSDKHWGVGGWLRWVFGVRLEYQRKRDYFLDKLAEYAPKDLVSTVPALGGMFQWLEVAIEKHPRFERTVVDGVEKTNTQELTDELWNFILEQGNVLVMPARLFQVVAPNGDESARSNKFRATFAGDLPTIDKALKGFGESVELFFKK
ncbi:L-tyrosine:2-oxoglutarate aminotransferase atrD [Vanrija pseudolonga]|uniref:L-tyrosine:2-oxoglutarate aminotransferase atrD n=1 Tax=Vanrija pseudolonga TaxID=143232 RepID=A0AAF1BJ19_9TREE|nr:L-tyrosine:2-oxoglutarate aminotransferase atrD [Vanrija pseudolonga]